MKNQEFSSIFTENVSLKTPVSVYLIFASFRSIISFSIKFGDI